MTIKRSHKGFALIPESIFEDNRLTPELLGVLVYLSANEDKPTTPRELASRFGLDPLEAVDLLEQLMGLGYLRYNYTAEV